MALAKHRMSSVQTCIHGEDLPTLFDDYHKEAIEEGHGNCFDKADHDGLIIKNLTMSHSSSPHGSSSSANSNEFVFQPTTHQSEEAHSLINFKAAAGGGYDSFIHANNGSFLNFQQSERISQTSGHREDYSSWEGNLSYSNYEWNNEMNPKCSSEQVRLIQDLNSFRAASNFSPMTDTRKEDNGNWLYSEAIMVADNMQESGTHDGNLQKRLNTGESLQATKKQCISLSPTKKPKPAKVSSPSKDPQSIAAKQRRERISERLKILQELVPNGSKVDLVTMLEKAISYVKFLQLQVKVLATDEFWPAQGGKAPDISEVKEAIDAILSSQKDRNSSSSSK